MALANTKNRMDTLRKSIRLPWKTGKRYNVLEGKENTYFNTPKPSNKRRHSIDGAQNCSHQNNVQQKRLQRNTSLTRSVRDAVGTLKQVIKPFYCRSHRAEDPFTPE